MPNSYVINKLKDTNRNIIVSHAAGSPKTITPGSSPEPFDCGRSPKLEITIEKQDERLKIDTYIKYPLWAKESFQVDSTILDTNKINEDKDQKDGYKTIHLPPHIPKWTFKIENLCNQANESTSQPNVTVGDDQPD